MTPTKAEMEHTTGWEKLAGAAAAYLPRAEGRRSRDKQRWWVTAAVQGGFALLCWRLVSAGIDTLRVERELRDQQHQALVHVLDEQARALRDLSAEIRANTQSDAEERAAARARREGAKP
jgi:hypothetical protein